MKRLAWLLPAALLAACGDGSTTTSTSTSGSGGAVTGAGGSTTSSSAGGAGGQGSTASASTTSAGGGSSTATGSSSSSAGGGSTSSASGSSASASASSSSGGQACGGSCPGGYVCGTANGVEVCRAPSGIPLFSHVFVIVMENTSLSTLQAAMNGNGAPNLKAMAGKYATGTDYHGVAHPSLPNYIALMSGDTQGIGCDCKAAAGQGSCNGFTCNLLLGSCSCDKPAMHLGDQLEAAQRTWRAFGDAMGAPCNLTDGGTYAVRHVPFLYFDNVQTNAARCDAHVVDLSALDMASPSDFNFIAPDLVHDMHDPFPAGAQNITNGDTWIGPEVTAITGSTAYKNGGLVVVVWDEDDASGGIGGSDDPIGIFVMSPYAKSGGYVSAAKMNHYSLLATIEDGLGLARLGKAGAVKPGIADTLIDYFPAN